MGQFWPCTASKTFGHFQWDNLGRTKWVNLWPHHLAAGYFHAKLYLSEKSSKSFRWRMCKNEFKQPQKRSMSKYLTSKLSKTKNLNIPVLKSSNPLVWNLSFFQPEICLWNPGTWNMIRLSKENDGIIIILLIDGNLTIWVHKEFETCGPVENKNNEWNPCFCHLSQRIC